jgi:hypothetical protein
MAFNWQINPPCEPDMTPWMLCAVLAVPAMIGGVEILKRLKAKRAKRRELEAAILKIAGGAAAPPPPSL